jgi:hypothetical protein
MSMKHSFVDPWNLPEHQPNCEAVCIQLHLLMVHQTAVVMQRHHHLKVRRTTIPNPVGRSAAPKTIGVTPGAVGVGVGRDFLSHEHGDLESKIVTVEDLEGYSMMEILMYGSHRDHSKLAENAYELHKE